MKKRKNVVLRLRRRVPRYPNEIETLVVKLIQDFAYRQPIQVIPQTKIIVSRDKFSACALVRLEEGTNHQRAALDISVETGVEATDLAVAPFDPRHPSLLRFIIPDGYESESHRNELFAFLSNKLTEYIKGVWREVNAFKTFQGVQTYANSDGEQVTIQSIRYATSAEDQEGYDLVLTLYTTVGGSKCVKLQVTGTYREGDKDYGKTGIVRYASNLPDPSPHELATFLLGLYEDMDGQEIYLPE